MTKHFGRRTQSGRTAWKFEAERTWSPLMLSNPTKPVAKALKEDKASDDPLRALVDACVSNVAVLEEAGNILYASKAWRLFQRGQGPEAERFDIAPSYLENCKRLTESEFDE